MNRKWEVCESLNTFSDVICEISPQFRVLGDIINKIDNNKKVGIHSGRFKEGSKVPLSICTMCHVVLQPTTEIQYNPDLPLENWINKSSSTDIIEKVALFEKQSLKEFQRYRSFICWRDTKYCLK